jgi:murein DD-endopeptidase MepM/ murein hydrolase activator NlpD
MFVLLAFALIACSFPKTAQAFSLTALDFNVLGNPNEPKSDANPTLPTLNYSETTATDAVKEATDSAAMDESFLKEYFMSSSLSTENPVERVLPLSPKVVKGISTYFSSVHLGIDIRADIGSPVMALRDGVVLENGFQAGGYGHYVVLEHKNADLRIRSLYAHLKSSAVSVGDAVTAKQTIGYVGMTGHTTGPHLHFETRLCQGEVDFYACAPIDPIRYITKGIPNTIAKK